MNIQKEVEQTKITNEKKKKKKQDIILVDF